LLRVLLYDSSWLGALALLLVGRVVLNCPNSRLRNKHTWVHSHQLALPTASLKCCNISLLCIS
jgi:hypothetical protein